MDEGAELRPHSPYAASKAAADRMAFAYHTSYRLDATILRPCNIYGERQKLGPGGAVIPIFASRALSRLPLKVFGSGNQRREYMHVRDLVAAYDVVLSRDDLAGVTLNVGADETASITEVAGFVASNTGVSTVSEPARAGEVQGFVLDSYQNQEPWILASYPLLGRSDQLSGARWSEAQRSTSISV